MTIARVTAQWSGFPGAPGYSNFFFEVAGSLDEQLGAPQRVRTAFSSILQQLPAGVRVQVSPTVEYIDEATGQLQDYGDAEETPDVVNGSASGNWAGPAGAVINWNTATVRDGRRVRGRTFIVPLASTAFQNDGTLGSSALSVLDNFATNIRGGAENTAGFVVWGRPSSSPGVAAPVTGHRVPDMAAVLRSRRD
uniref:Uncharacterized protein n=1 Tax=uncultured prokaryote TaxID=198431 RepID=A0A0H5PZT2_9ZZZZ|nr:hypothetical protein [uncultured prokaryote]